MVLEEIYELWQKDSIIDKTELGDESLKIPQLHHKYFKIYSNERLLLKKFESDFKTLRLEKYEFYTQGPTKETQERGWILPASGKILKSEVNTYIEADKDIIKISLRIGVQQEKIELLDSIIRTLNNRGYNIRAAIDWYKFTMGV